MISILEQMKKKPRKYLPYFSVDPTTGFMSKTYVKKTKPKTYVTEQAFRERLSTATHDVKKTGMGLAGVGAFSYGLKNRQKLKNLLSSRKQGED